MRNLVPISFSSSQTLGRENAFANRLWTRSGRESKRERDCVCLCESVSVCVSLCVFCIGKCTFYSTRACV